MMDKLLYGVAYYDEYMPYERLEKDVVMLKAAGINVVRIAESTWSTLEPYSGVYDFTSIDRVLKVMEENEISVIVGTPTYAVPTWMVQEHPDILAVTAKGKNLYGPRQNMDITNPKYLFYCERVIRKLLDHVKDSKAVIGYQVDNETKHYGVTGKNIQYRFVKYMKEKYKSLDSLNEAMGLDYWSNRIHTWEDFPDVTGTINASLQGDYERFRRELVEEFLRWQVTIVNEYKAPHQFVTHNFDFDWRGYSYGLQPDVNHFKASQAMDIVGVDIYHPSQDDLTGCEISFCGDMARSMKRDNYLVIETQAQGQAGWLPFPGQLRLQAFSHVASGANMVSYWHYHSIHNSLETYWKGLLSHDFEPNRTYEEAKTIGADFKAISDQLINLKMNNKVAFLVSHPSLSALQSFEFSMGLDYNTLLRQMYDALYKLNIGCDMIDEEADLQDYEMIIVPSLYVAGDELLHTLNTFTHEGGHVIYGIRSGFANETVKVRSTHQPGIIGTACGIYYNQFTESKGISLDSVDLNVKEDDRTLQHWIELIEPMDATVLARYNHPYWKEYAAVTTNRYGRGSATYIGCCPTEAVYKKIYQYVIEHERLEDIFTDARVTFPIITKKAINQFDRSIRFYFNYSMQEQRIIYNFQHGVELFSQKKIEEGMPLSIEPWGIRIIEER